MISVKWLLPAVMVLSIVFLLSACQPIMVTPSREAEPATALGVGALAQFESDVDELRQELMIPGLSAAIVKDQEVIWAKGFGHADLENQIPATEDTAYEIASLTKPFAAALLMQLVETGQLDLDVPMAEILQDTVFMFPPPAQAPAEGYAALCAGIQEIGRSTSGPMAPYAFLFQDYRCDTELIAVRHHLTHTAQGTPGDGYRYNGFLYGLLSWVIEAVTGEEYEQVLVNDIIEPLEMVDTVPNPDSERAAEILAEMARPYQVDDSGTIVRADYQTTGHVDAASGMVSTVLDLAKFDAAMDRDLLISADTKAAMFTPTLSNSGETLPYGMGWFVQEDEGKQLVWHYGWETAYSSLIVKVPEQNLTFILLANSDGASSPFNLGAGDGLNSPFAALFLDLFADPEAEPEPISAQPDVAPTFEETACPFTIPTDVVEGEDVVCGHVIVREDHGSATGPHIRLAVVVVKDKSDGHQPDPVLLLSGGPGERVVANAPMLSSFLESIYPNRDLILFDQRGVGLSEPALECPEFLEAQFEILDETDSAVAAKIVHAATKACADRLVDEDHHLSVYNTTQNAADVDAIRRALGYEWVNLYGGSYGSLLAQAVMRDHPENIRSVVLTSVLPLEKSLFVDASATTTQAILRLLDTCAANKACNAAYPDLQAKLFEVIDRLNAEPVDVTVTNPMDGESYDALLTGETLRANLVTFLYTTQIIPVLPQAIYDVYEGDYELMTQLSSTRLALLDLISRGMTFSVVCTEDLIGRTPDDLLALMASLPRQLVVGAEPEAIIQHGIFGICADWPVTETDPSVKEPLVSDISTLVLAGELDPVTPPEYGELVADYLSNGYFYEFPGVGHNIIIEECARQLAGAFLADPSQAPDAACITDMAGVVFDLPLADAPELLLEPFTDEVRGFSGLVPVGWEELAPANLARKTTALDPTYFVLEGTPGTAAELFGNLAGQLGLDPEMAPDSQAQVGNFAWDFYSFERGGNLTDLALAEDGEKAYFVFMISATKEHDLLVEQLFMPAVAAMASLSVEPE